MAKVKSPSITSDQVVVGKKYRSRRPRFNIFGEPDDRHVIYVGGDTVQYDSITVRDGRRYPTIKMDVFLRWAGSIVEEPFNG